MKMENTNVDKPAVVAVENGEVDKAPTNAEKYSDKKGKEKVLPRELALIPRPPPPFPRGRRRKQMTASSISLFLC